MGAFSAISCEKLPASIPVFPLPRVILLPRVTIPLNIFEPRYIAMTDAAMASSRLIGMIQEKPDGGAYKTGCAGRITAFKETDDGRYSVTLTGICRFNVKGDPVRDGAGFLRVAADWVPYAADLKPDDTADVCREAIMRQLRDYFDKMNMFCDQWESMHDVSCEKLISTLSVICPFDAPGKQALLEAPTLEQRIRILQALLEDAVKSADTKNFCH